jgi:hypothetical protein
MRSVVFTTKRLYRWKVRRCSAGQSRSLKPRNCASSLSGMLLTVKISWPGKMSTVIDGWMAQHGICDGCDAVPLNGAAAFKAPALWLADGVALQQTRKAHPIWAWSACPLVPSLQSQRQQLYLLRHRAAHTKCPRGFRVEGASVWVAAHVSSRWRKTLRRAQAWCA